VVPQKLLDTAHRYGVGRSTSDDFGKGRGRVAPESREEARIEVRAIGAVGFMANHVLGEVVRRKRFRE
jgi:hypothetical protein